MELVLTPNWLAFFALLIWPIVVVALYSTLSVEKATIWSILGGYMLLPVGAGIKLAMVPQFDKTSIPSVTAFLIATFMLRPRVKILKRAGLVEVLIVALVVCPLVTSILNADPIVIGDRYLPGLDGYEGISAAMAQFIALIPLFLGRQLLRKDTGTRDILIALVIGGLLYSLPILFEERMSPQLHTWVYGYFPHTMFGQQIRDGGFRAVVFLGHGLLVAFFVMSSGVASVALWRVGLRIGPFRPGAISAYLAIILVTCKSLGSLIYGAMLMPAVRWTPLKLQANLATLLVLIALGYPILRATNLVPTRSMVELAEAISPDRADSLQVRFTQEFQLLERASERFWFGWGRFGRSRVYDQSGKDISFTDGYWIVTMGQFGFIGFLIEFGLLAVSVFQAHSALRLAVGNQERVFLVALMLIVAIGIVDLLPNASIRPWTWLMAGALLGRAEELKNISNASRPNRKLPSARDARLSMQPIDRSFVEVVR